MVLSRLWCVRAPITQCIMSYMHAWSIRMQIYTKLLVTLWKYNSYWLKSELILYVWFWSTADWKKSLIYDSSLLYCLPNCHGQVKFRFGQVKFRFGQVFWNTYKRNTCTIITWSGQTNKNWSKLMHLLAYYMLSVEVCKLFFSIVLTGEKFPLVLKCFSIKCFQMGKSWKKE